MAGKYRHEYKYVAPEGILSSLEGRVRAIMPLDSHAGSNHRYQIRSIYLDDMYDTYYRENEAGSDPREKFRIRIYNCDSSRITLELKQKRSSLCHKVSERLDLERCKLILSGYIPPVHDSDGFLVRSFFMKMQSRGLRPVVIVSYERDPYVWKMGNVRVTFDRNIRSSTDFSHFFDPDLASRPVLGVGTHMMEVKYDELLPDFLHGMLETSLLRATSFSKYYLCRRFSMDGMRPE